MKKYLKKLMGAVLILALCQPIYGQVCGGTSGGTSTSTGSSFGSTGSVASLNSGGSTQFALNNLMAQVSANQFYSASTTSFYAQTDGSPYLFEEYQEAHIVLNNDAVMENVEVNYDGYAGEVIAINEDGDKIVLDARYYKEINVDNRDYQVTFRKPNPRQKDKFYPVLYDNAGLAFYKEPHVILREGTKNGIADTPDKFVMRSKYYVVNGDSDPIAVNLKKRDVFDHFPEIEMIAINEVLKKQKLKLKKEKDYIALFAQL